MRMNRRSMVVSFGLLLGACGGGSTPSSMSSGLDSGKVASSLSATEQKTLCTRSNEYFMSLYSKGDTCKMAALVAGALAGKDSLSEVKNACSAMYNTCMQSPEEKEDNTKSLSECTEGLSDCSATVGEIETCHNDTGAAMKAVMADVPSCSQITEATLGSTSTPTYTEPESCKTLQTKCPNLNNDQSSGSGS